MTFGSMRVLWVFGCRRIMIVFALSLCDAVPVTGMMCRNGMFGWEFRRGSQVGSHVLATVNVTLSC